MIIVPSVDKYGGQDTDGQFVLFTKARQYFWDSNALQWVRATASSGGVPSNDVTDRPGRLLGHVSIDAGGTMVGSALASASLPVVIASDQTVPISAASLPLPAGASTSAKQPALGTAGTASADVITVQGIASMTALKVDGSGVTQPVSGTVTANIGTSGSLALDASVTGLQVAQESTTAAQKGTLAMGAVTTAAPSYTTAKTDMLSLTPAGGLRVDGSAVTQPISAASLPLPAGASTSAKQPALGTAGTASADVITVQGIASMTALKVDGSAVTQPVSGTVTANIGTSGSLALDTSVNGLLLAQESTTATQKGTLAMGAVTTAAPSYTTAKTDMLSLTPAGGLRVDGSAVTQPISAASLPLPAGASTSAKQPALGTAGTASADVITVQGIASMTALKVDGSVTGTYGAPTNVAASVTTGTLQASNVSRRGLIVSNDSTSKLYVLFGAGTVSSTNYTYVIPPGGTLEEMTPLSTAICTGVWQSANGTAGVTEIT